MKLVSSCSTTWVWRGMGEEEEAGEESCISLRFIVASSDLLETPKFSIGKVVLERSTLGSRHCLPKPGGTASAKALAGN